MQQLKDKDTRYTVRDYQSWPDDERWELIDGVAYDMSPAPRPLHQGLVVNISSQLFFFLKGKPCRAYISPIDVYLLDDVDGDTVVQPDILVVCDPSKVKEHGIVGAPDVVIEVLSPSTTGRDMLVKRRLYERSGVKEYWIVSATEQTVYILTLTDGRYTEEGFKGMLTSKHLEGFTMDVVELFGSPENT